MATSCPGLCAGEPAFEGLGLGQAAAVRRVLGTACASLGRLDDASRHFRNAMGDSSGGARAAAAVEESDMWQRAGRIDRAIAALDARLSIPAGSAYDLALATRRAGLARPRLPVPDHASTTTEGEIVRLSSSRGQVLLLFFSATYSSDAVAAFGELRKLHRELGPRGFEILGVSLDTPGDRQLLRSQLVRHGVTWKTLVSDSGEWHPIALAFGFRNVPQTILVDRDFLVVATGFLGRELAEAARKAVGRKQGARGRWAGNALSPLAVGSWPR
jgi:peroxiredoxin